MNWRIHLKTLSSMMAVMGCMWGVALLPLMIAVGMLLAGLFVIFYYLLYQGFKDRKRFKQWQASLKQGKEETSEPYCQKKPHKPTLRYIVEP